MDISYLSTSDGTGVISIAYEMSSTCKITDLNIAMHACAYCTTLTSDISSTLPFTYWAGVYVWTLNTSNTSVHHAPLTTNCMYVLHVYLAFSMSYQPNSLPCLPQNLRGNKKNILCSTYKRCNTLNLNTRIAHVYWFTTGELIQHIFPTFSCAQTLYMYIYRS